MDKLLLVNKEKGYTSRDIVNIVSGILKTKKIGHFGTLDPLAQGLLILGIGKYTKLCDINLFNTKEYIAEALIGIKTDTYDLEGSVLEERLINLDKETIIQTLNSFEKTYLQEVPIYSSVKVNGKKLYEYARENKKVELPKKEVTIYKIEFIDIYTKDNKTYFKFKVLVSKGTYIRSLINDIGLALNIPLCMSNLLRTKQGDFKLEDASTIKDIETGNYKLYDIEDFVPITIKNISENEKEIVNGCKQKRIITDKDLILYVKDDKKIVLYKRFDEEYNKVLFFY